MRRKSKEKELEGVQELEIQQDQLQDMNHEMIQYDSSWMMEEDWHTVLEEICNPPKSKLRDSHSIRTATAATALIETLREQLNTASKNSFRDNDNLEDTHDEHTPGNDPAAIFTASLATLSASCSTATSSPQQPLLEIIRRVIPFVSRSNPNLYRVQFHVLLRGITSIIASIPSVVMNHTHTVQEETLVGGWNSLLRQCIRTTSTALIALILLTSNVSSEGGGGGEKDIVACFHSLILQHLEDSRPKVRKEACAAITDILQATNHKSNKNKDNKALLFIPKHLTRYIHQIIDTLFLSNKDALSSSSSSSSQYLQRETKILHTLTLLENIFLYLSYDMRFELWGVLISFTVFSISNYSSSKVSLLEKNITGTHTQQLSNQTIIVQAALQACIQCLGGLVVDSSSMTQDEHDRVHYTTKHVLVAKDHITKSLASLLQLQSILVPFADMNRSSVANHDGADCIVLYTRCIVSLVDTLVNISLPAIPENLVDEKEKTMATVTQLLPLCFSSLLYCMEEESRPGTSAQNHSLKILHPLTLQGICAELGRLVRVVKCLFSKDFQGLKQNQRHCCIHECMTSMHKVLTLKIGDCWRLALSALAAMIVIATQGLVPYSEMLTDKVNEVIIQTVKEHVQPTLMIIILLYKTLGDQNKTRDSIERALIEVIHGIGIELFVIMVPLTGDFDPEATLGQSDSLKSRKIKDKVASTPGLISQDRAWILRVLKSSTVNSSYSTVGTIDLIYRPKLAFFVTTVLSWARASDKACAMPNLSAAEGAVHRSKVVDAWSLFPSFCYSPVDLQSSLRSVAQILVRALGDSRYPDLITIVCSGLKILVQTVTSHQTVTDMNVLTEVSTTVLPSLFKLVETLNERVASESPATKSKDNSMHMSESEEEEEDVNLEDSTKWSENLQRVTIVTDAITSFSTIAPRFFVQTLFKKLLHRLLVAAQSQDDAAESLCAMLGLSLALVRSKVLDEDSVALLYRSIRPLIRSDVQCSRVQKRAYKVMAGICEHYVSFVVADERLTEMTELFVGSSMTLHVPARQMRLKCMMFVAKSLDESKPKHMGLISDVMGEILLCLKDANSKTRDSAYQLLMVMAEIRKNFSEYIQIILAALGAQTSHMRSAAVMALSRIVFEYASTVDTVKTLVPSLIQTVLVLFNENSREVVKAVIGFIRVGIANTTREELEPLLSDIVEGLMKFNKGKGRFRSKIKIILKKLVRYYGYEVITPLIPSSDSRLITHIRKLSERAIRNKNRTNEDRDSQTVVRRFDELMSSDEDDSDNGKTLMTGATGWTKKTHARTASDGKGMGSVKSVKSSRSMTSAAGPRINIGNENDGEAVDLLDPRSTSNVNNPEYDEYSEFSDDDDEDDEFMMFDDHGKLVIKEKTKGSDDKCAEEEDDEAFSGEQAPKRQRLSKFENAKLERDEEMRRKRTQFSFQRKQNVRDLGSAYKSKKAGGDVKRKDQQFEPYAYVPLDGKRYTKKNRRNTVAEMATVVRSKKRKNR